MASGTKRMPYMHMCGVPRELCSGRTNSRVNMALGTVRKLHPTPEDAFKCHQRYLISLGFKQLGPREFLTPDGVRILNKPSRFGAKLRNGKEGTRNMSNVKIKGGGRRGGNIVSV